MSEAAKPLSAEAPDTVIRLHRNDFQRPPFRACALSCCALVALLFCQGCTSAVASGSGTALDSMDLEQMTNRMAASIAGDPDVREVIEREGALKVVVQPVENQMTGEVLPRGAAEAYTARLRYLLSRQARGDYVWVMNRETFYRLRNAQREDVLGPSPDAVNPQYALWGHFHSLTSETSKGRSAAYLCVFELTDLDRRTVLWTDRYEVRKATVKSFLD